MGCSESTHFKSSMIMSRESTLDTCKNSPVKTIIKPQEDDLLDFVDFDTSELAIEQTSYHFYDSILQRVVSVPKLKSITTSSILSRRKNNKKY
ncbi:unnamed protein product [Paramecium sonneborni]|uniref:Uncharacterized protein n=1 Tax=Paramecium sonneborni TaxID=65129 RepID=A0A8S1RA61_9CILI|nr:unnamed protein product [Paramecium sonneborni]